MKELLTTGTRAALVAICLALGGVGSSLAASCDVCVVGGGVAGVAAALQAGRAGARTVLVEQAAMVGGNMTSGGVNWPGLFHAWGRQVIDGCGWELVTNCVALAGGTLPDFSRDPGRWHWKHQVRINAPLWVALAEEELTKAGVEIRYHTAPKVARFRDGGWDLTLSAIGEESHLEARVLIDATGNGALAALCGAKRLRDPSACQPGSFTYLINPHADESAIDWPVVEKAATEAVKDGRLEPTDICRGVRFLVHESNVVLCNFADGPDHGTTIANYVVGADNSTATLRTKTNMRGRAAMLRVYRFLKSQPGLERATLVEMSPEVGVRETYRVEGDYILTGDDYASGRVFDDSVCHAFYPIDMHTAEKGVHPKHLTRGTVATVPLRSLEVKGTRNLLVAGRCISADRAANSALRVQATCMATGQAAGAAAALAARRKCDVRQLPLEELKSALRATGAIVPSDVSAAETAAVGGAALCAAAGLWIGGAFAGPNGTVDSWCGLTYTRTALWPGFDGKYCKMTPSVATDGKGLAFMSYGMLLLTGSDVFCGSYVAKSTDGGETWSAPRAVSEFPDTREHGLRVTRSCNPCYNRTRDLWFGLGLALCYENDRVPFLKVVDGRPYGWPLFAKFDPMTGKFSEAVKIDFPLPYARAYPFGQMVELDDGDMLVPFIYEPLELARNKNDGYTVKGRVVIVRCRVDENGLKIVSTGKPIACDGLRRGVCEPSLIRLGKTFYLTLRSDEYGMWCTSEDGLNFSAPKRWTWTDGGKEIGNRNTQQHWMKVGGKLYLAYTRVTPANGHVFRNRAPVFLAEFDPSRGGLVRETERPVVPERGARLGNFCCTEDGHGGAWLVTAEWMQPIGCEKYGSDNSIWLVKVAEKPAANRSRGILLLTFDDALFHDWDKALPLFDRYGAHATFFVNGRLTDRLLMKMRTYQSYGHSVGLHSANHASAAQTVAKKGVDAWFGAEILSQLAALKKANLTVRNFAYPNSNRDGKTDAALAPHFDHLRTGHIFGRDPAKDPLATCDAAFISREKLASSRVLSGMGFGSKFPGIAEDLERGLERLAARNEVLVLYSHDIMAQSDGGASICNNTTLDVLERILAKAHALGIAVIGFDEIGSPSSAAVCFPNQPF